MCHSNSFIKNLNLTERWICVLLPKTVDQGFQLIGTPVPRAVNWNRYWYNTTFTDTYKEQIWAIQLPKQWNYSQVHCVQRRYPSTCSNRFLCQNHTIVGNWTNCQSTTTISSGLQLRWQAPPDLGIFWLCGTTAYKALPLAWRGICALGVLTSDLQIHPEVLPKDTWHRTYINRVKRNLNPLRERPAGFHSLLRCFMPSLGVSELEKAILNISGETEKLANSTAHGLLTLQKEVSEFSKITIQNRMALDLILASQGGVCTILSVSCCMYTDHSGELITDVQKIWEIGKQMQQVQKDDTSWGFTDAVSWLTSWFPNLATWLKKALVILFFVVTIVVCLFVIFQCILTCLMSITKKCQKEVWKYSN